MTELERWAKMTDQEKRLAEMCEEYEREFFSDIWQLEIIENALEWGADLEYKMSITGSGFFRVRKLPDGVAGRYNKRTKTITINKEHLEKPIVLHEMIHFYESTLERINPAIKEYWMLTLYNSLKSKISDIDDCIMDHGEMFSLSDLEREGGRHGILFF